MMTTRKQVLDRVAELGATLDEGGGRWFTVTIEAPHGYCFEDGVHELVNEQHDESRGVLWADIMARLAGGVVLCSAPDCEWCGDGAINAAPRCDECDSRLFPIGRLLFCPKKGCSMYDRAVTVEEIERDVLPLHQVHDAGVM